MRGAVASVIGLVVLVVVLAFVAIDGPASAQVEVPAAQVSPGASAVRTGGEVTPITILCPSEANGDTAFTGCDDDARLSGAIRGVGELRRRDANPSGGLH